MRTKALCGAGRWEHGILTTSSRAAVILNQSFSLVFPLEPITSNNIEQREYY